MKTNTKFFGKKIPAWMLLAALVVMGAGAATGLVLKDQIDGTTTIAVSQAIRVGAPVSGVGDDSDEFLGTVDDDGMSWMVHFEANNGDTVVFNLPVINEGANPIVCGMTMTIPEGLTVSMTEDGAGEVDDVTQVGPNYWKFTVTGTAAGAADDIVIVTIAIEDAVEWQIEQRRERLLPGRESEC